MRKRQKVNIEKKRDDEEQSQRFFQTARKIGAGREQSQADELLGQLAKMPPEPRKKKDH
jgi:hypothetical protein